MTDLTIGNARWTLHFQTMLQMMTEPVFKRCVMILTFVSIVASCDQGSSQAELETELEAEEARQAIFEAEEKRQKEKENERRRWKVKIAEQELEAKKEREKAKKLAKRKRVANSKAKALAAQEKRQELDWKVIEEKMFARGSMANVLLGDIRTKTGKSFRGAEVKGTSSVGITIYHRDGVDDVEYANLSQTLQKKFHYDPQEAADYKAGKIPPRLPSERRRAVQDRISEVLTAQHDAEIMALEKQLQDRRDTEELRSKAKVALMKAEDRLRAIQERRRADPELESRQKVLVTRYRKIINEASAKLKVIKTLR